MNKFVAVFLAVVLWTGVATAGLFIDQQQTDGSVYMAAFSQTDLAQSFQQAHDNVAGAGIFLEPGVGGTDSVIIGLWDALPNAGGNLLAGGSGTGTAGTWFDVEWTPVVVTPGDTLYLVFSGNTTLGITGAFGDPYPYGMLFANPGYQPFASWDYAFRTYFDDELLVPLPGAVLLGMLGLSSAGYLLRRKVA
jgi:hypothetical protein